ncbi:hypothetical protein Y032_0279g1195 [Ancylostoma ceylanicum]|nr:hypothetical protein Y032_0279g1195 [Ancylostoma ceylanicum]
MSIVNNCSPRCCHYSVAPDGRSHRRWRTQISKLYRGTYFCSLVFRYADRCSSTIATMKALEMKTIPSSMTT